MKKLQAELEERDQLLLLKQKEITTLEALVKRLIKKLEDNNVASMKQFLKGVESANEAHAGDIETREMIANSKEERYQSQERQLEFSKKEVENLHEKIKLLHKKEAHQEQYITTLEQKLKKAGRLQEFVEGLEEPSPQKSKEELTNELDKLRKEETSLSKKIQDYDDKLLLVTKLQEKAKDDSNDTDIAWYTSAINNNQKDRTTAVASLKDVRALIDELQRELSILENDGAPLSRKTTGSASVVSSSSNGPSRDGRSSVSSAASGTRTPATEYTESRHPSSGAINTLPEVPEVYDEK